MAHDLASSRKTNSARFPKTIPELKWPARQIKQYNAANEQEPSLLVAVAQSASLSNRYHIIK